MSASKRKGKKEDKKATLLTESNRPVVPTDSNRPVVSTDSNRPVVPTGSSRNKDKLMVCAIDFGTTYSGYAYSMRSDPMKIFCPQWRSGMSTLASNKTPTTVLLDREQKFVAFGYEAEKMYSEYVEEDEADDYFYFRRFKMMLYENTMKEVSNRIRECHFQHCIF